MSYGNMSKNIRSINSMKAGSKRQGAIKNLTKKSGKQGTPGKPLATLPSNASVRKGKESGGKSGAKGGKPNAVKSNASSKSVTGKPMGGGKMIGNLGGKVSGRMNTGGKARRVM